MCLRDTRDVMLTAEYETNEESELVRKRDFSKPFPESRLNIDWPDDNGLSRVVLTGLKKRVLRGPRRQSTCLSRSSGVCSTVAWLSPLSSAWLLAICDKKALSTIPMDVASIREALHRQPFEPFKMQLADGRALPVPHPDFVAVSRRRIVVLAEDDSWSFVEPLLIVSLDKLKAPAKGGNGAKKKKKGR